MRASADVELEPGLVVEDPSSGFVGAVLRWERGLVDLEDRHGRTRSYPIGPGFWVDGEPVRLVVPTRRAAGPARTASGSIAVDTRARVARDARIYVEGRHDAELVEKVWGDDLRVEGVVVEYLGGIDDLTAIVRDFAPGTGRRLGVLVDHLVAGSKETRIVADVVRRYPDHVLVVGHPYVDVWQVVRPDRLGLTAWPQIPRGQSWKHGILEALGWPAESQADVAAGWRRILASVRTYADLEPSLTGRVEQLIDFVTAEG